MSTGHPRRVRCAIYTRKSSEEGLEQDFNSLDAQAEACGNRPLSPTDNEWPRLPDAKVVGSRIQGRVYASTERVARDIGIRSKARKSAETSVSPAIR